MIHTIRVLVKSYGEDKIVLLNSASVLHTRNMVTAVNGNHLFTAGHGKAGAIHGLMLKRELRKMNGL